MVVKYSDHIQHYDLDARDMPMPEDMGHFRRSLEKRRFHVIADLVPYSAASCVLDAGCGSGWLTEILSRRGFNVYSLDLGLDSIRRASARIGRVPDMASGSQVERAVFFTLGDVYRLPYDDRCFDAVVASEILEHLDRPEAAVQEFSRVIRPGGTLVVSTPYDEEIEYTLCIHCNRKTPVNAHLHSFDEKKIEQLLGSAGFSLNRTIRFVSRPAERLGLAGLTASLPHSLWRMFDGILCALFGRQTFMAVKAIRSGY